MSFEIGDERVDADELLARLRQRIAEKKERGLYTDDEVREIAGRPLHPVLGAHDLKSGLLGELQARATRWNYDFDPETIYRSSRGGVLEKIRRVLRPVQKLFWNPTPMIAALSRQKDLNASYAHVLHNLVLETTRLRLELDELRSRNLQLQARLDLLARREQTLEAMAVLKDGGTDEA